MQPRMRISKDQMLAKIDVPGASARQATDFGDTTGYGKLGGEYFTLGAGTDIAPLLIGGLDVGRITRRVNGGWRARREDQEDCTAHGK